MSNLKRTIAQEFEHSDEEFDNEPKTLGFGKKNVGSKEPVIPLIEQNEWRTGKELEYGLNKKQRKNVPILSMNAFPGTSVLATEKERYKHDVNLRPDQEDNDYNQMPVEEFGAALLRGMGWSQGKPVGKNPNGLVEPVLVNSRPSLLGLGAEPAPELEPKKEKRVLPGDIIQEKPKIVHAPIVEAEPDRIHKVGTKVIITNGSKKGNKGKIVDVSVKSDGIAVKIQLQDTDKIVSVWDDQIEVDERPWIRPHIRVRIVSKTLRNGDYYNEKCVVQDVTSRGICIIKTSSGIILDKVRQHQLETVIPKVGKMVMIVRHHDQDLVGQLAHLIEYDSKKDQVLIQADHTYEYHTLGFDDIAEYVEH